MLHQLCALYLVILNVFCFVLLFSLCFGETATNQLPSYIKPCRRDDPKLNECVKAIIEGLRSQMAEGIPELLVPPCEPLIVPQLNISQRHGAVHAVCECTNIEVKGPSNFQLQSVRVYLNKDEFRLIIRFPELHMKSNYKLQGKILMLPLHGAGVMTGTYTDIDAVAILKCKRQQKDGREHLAVKNLKIEFHIGSLSIHLSDLFGNKELSDQMNKFLNEKWRLISKDIKPSLEEGIADLIRNIAERLFEQYTMDQLLPV